MNRALAPLALLLCALPGQAAQAAPFEVQSRTLTLSAAAAKNLSGGQEQVTHGSIRMPWVSSAAPEVARRVNDLLYLDLLELPVPAPGRATFSPPADLVPEISAMDFKVTRNDDRLLVIRADGEGCGAYCETFVRTFDVDARNGHAVSLDELFTPQGLAAVVRRMQAERVRRFTAQVKSLKQTLAGQGAHGKKDELKDTQDRIEFNEMCLEEEKDARERDDPPPAFDFSLAAAHGITLTSERCSNHASLALDDVLAVDLALAPAELATMLTPYGRFLALGEGDVPPPVTPFGQVLHGRIGGAPVTFFLQRMRADGSVGGDYFYDRFGRVINVSGKRQGATLLLTEPGDNHLTLTPHGAGVDGQWEGKGRKLPVTLAW